jgi:predicted nucleic acid-binding protein
MILIDTSVWIEFFKQNKILTSEVEMLLKKNMVVTVEPVFAELLYGARNEKEKKKILAYWNVLPKIRFSNETLLNAADFSNRNNYHNKGIGLIDAAIAMAAIENQFKIWTLDTRLIRGIEKQYLYKY